MPMKATIYLDNEVNTYYAGQTLNGRIEYDFENTMEVKGIYVKLKGEASTFWVETKDETDAEGKTRKVDVNLSGNEEYFNFKYQLLANSKEGEKHVLPAGKHTYNFSCALPPNVPSSFEGEYGYVRYTVKVTIDRPWKFDKETKIAFTVVNPLDLNLNPSYKKPLRLQMEKTFGCLCCTSPPLTVDVQAPVSGYCPGQVIPLDVNVENNSSVLLHLVKIFLMKKITYRAQGSVKKESEVIKTIQEGPVEERNSKQWLMRLEVPPLPPSNLVNCTIIDLDYELKVECEVSGIHFNLKDKQYITIGTVPLVEFTNEYGKQDVNVNPVVTPTPPVPTAPPSEGDGVGWTVPQPPPTQALYPSLAAPVYMRSPYEAKSIHDKDDNQYTAVVSGNFAPRYPTYGAVLPPPLPQ